MGIYKFGNNTNPRCIRRRSNLGHIFGGKSASYGLGNTVLNQQHKMLYLSQRKPAVCYTKYALKNWLHTIFTDT